ncbi:MAG: 3-phosphoinositide dependent protein kinase-1 [Thelocarpon superellum]|nr:MAG: 3-phosphoinositide dependent protein kinase-1 [Thelocarpon superellum]
MENDLSLSQSLGGLRIANPDYAAPSSPRDDLTDTTSSPTSRTPSSSDQLSQLQLSLPLAGAAPNRTPSPRGVPPHAPGIPSPHQHESQSDGTGLRDRRSMPLSHQAQQQQPQQQPQQQQYAISTLHPGSPDTSTSSTPVASPRPSSAIYPQSSQQSIMNSHTYRLRSESSRSSMTTPPRRSSSRSSSSVLQAGVPTREGSHSDRSYRQSRNISAGNGPLPPRRSSRALNGAFLKDPLGSPSAAAAALGSAYPAEAGPLASSEEWKDRGAAVGVQREIDRDGNQISRTIKKGVKDFNFGRTLGEGSYSTVIAATDRQTLREYAIKVLDKRHIIKEKKVKYVNIEKDTLNRLTDHPGVVRLYYTFQDERSLYFVLDVASGGELLGVLKRMTTFDEECTRFYGAEILDTIDYMHSRGVIHRDLKPENVLLDETMHVKITDFGTAKILDPPRPRAKDGLSDPKIPLTSDLLDTNEANRANSFVGTAEYVSPELLREKNACKASDLWAFGCIIFQLLAGRPPFKAGNEYLTFQKICALEYDFPYGFPPIARDLVERLLVLEPEKRLPIEHIKNHEFFDGIRWGRGLWKQKPPRLRAYIPPTAEPSVIKLNGQSNDASPPSIPKAPTSGPRSGHANGAPRPQPRIVTEVPPPSQLDIEWSPVLTGNNERILKIGDQNVHASTPSHSPSSKNGLNGEANPEPPKKFSRFFGGSTMKKRQRLVMITSTARIMMAAAGGEEKKTKTEVSLLAPGTTWRISRDAKGLATWCVQTPDKVYTFEEAKVSAKEPEVAMTAAQEWIDTIDRAKEIATSQSQANSYSGDDAFRDLNAAFSSPSRTPGFESSSTIDDMNGLVGAHDLPLEPPKARKRFSKRQSKSGLTAVF